jgi:hypothetical protein
VTRLVILDPLRWTTGWRSRSWYRRGAGNSAAQFGLVDPRDVDELNRKILLAERTS